MCDACDANLEAELQGQFLNELCDCEAPTRWMCYQCVSKESKETREMYARNTISETGDGERWEELFDDTKCMTDHQFTILVNLLLAASSRSQSDAR